MLKNDGLISFFTEIFEFITFLLYDLTLELKTNKFNST